MKSFLSLATLREFNELLLGLPFNNFKTGSFRQKPSKARKQPSQCPAIQMGEVWENLACVHLLTIGKLEKIKTQFSLTFNVYSCSKVGHFNMGVCEDF